MIRIDLMRENSNHPDRKKRHLSRASCEVGGQHYETAGPAIVTLLWLHGYSGERFEVWDDRDPFGKPGGLGLCGRVRNWASFETPKGMPMFRMKSKLDPDFTTEQRVIVAKAAGLVVSCDADSRETLSPGRTTRSLGGPNYPQERDGPSTAVVGAQASEAA